jgi:Signal peptidase, peptidase S26
VIQIPPGHVWLEGDNSVNSQDSRYYGPVPYAMLVGRAWLQVGSIEFETLTIPILLSPLTYTVRQLEWEAKRGGAAVSFVFCSISWLLASSLFLHARAHLWMAGGGGGDLPIITVSVFGVSSNPLPHENLLRQLSFYAFLFLFLLLISNLFWYFLCFYYLFTFWLLLHFVPFLSEFPSIDEDPEEWRCNGLGMSTLHGT